MHGSAAVLFYFLFYAISSYRNGFGAWLLAAFAGGGLEMLWIGTALGVLTGLCVSHDDEEDMLNTCCTNY